MRDLDFLPEWYKDGKRRHSAVRKQYIALVAVFLVMMAFNLTATHRAARVAAEVSRHEAGRAKAEAVVHEFSAVVKELNQMGAKAKLVRQVDTRFDVAAVLAEISHIVDESVVLSKVELVAEPFAQPEDRGRTTNAPVRAAARTGDAERAMPLGDSKLRVVLAGVAAHPANVADLVCRLEESSFFQQVRPSFYSKTKIQVGASRDVPRPVDAAGANAAESLDVTAFEITCYLANYEQIEGS